MLDYIIWSAAAFKEDKKQAWHQPRAEIAKFEAKLKAKSTIVVVPSALLLGGLFLTRNRSIDEIYDASVNKT